MSEPGPLRGFLGTIGGHRRWVAATAVIATAAATSGIGLIAFAAVLISRSALLSSTASLALLIVAVRFFATTRVVLRYVERMVGHLGTFRLLTRIRTWFFDSVIPIAPRGLTDRTTGHLLSSILDDVDTMQDLYLRVLVPPVVATLTLSVATATIAVIDPIAALTMLLILATASALLLLLTRSRSRAAITEIADGREEITSLVIESLDAARELAMFGAQATALERSTVADRSIDAARIRLASAHATASAIIAVAVPATAMGLAAVGITAVRNGSVPGELLAMLPLIALAASEVLPTIAGSLDARDRSRAAAGRLLALADRGADRSRRDTERSVNRPAGPGMSPSDRFDSAGASVEVGGLGLETSGGDRILDDVTFSVPTGGVLVISGPSGSGKSTIIDLLLGLDDHEGHIRIDGIDQSSRPAAEARLPFAAVRQFDHVFDTTIRDNLSLADPETTDERILEVLRIVGLDEVVAAMPEQLATRTGPDGDRLSGGERQRLLIARALLAGRPILLLDEVFEHLDGDRRDLVLRSVLEHRRGRTTILVTHDPMATDSSTQLLRMRDGRVQ